MLLKQRRKICLFYIETRGELEKKNIFGSVNFAQEFSPTLQ